MRDFIKVTDEILTIISDTNLLTDSDNDINTLKANRIRAALKNVCKYIPNKNAQTEILSFSFRPESNEAQRNYFSLGNDGSMFHFGYNMGGAMDYVSDLSSIPWIGFGIDKDLAKCITKFTTCGDSLAVGFIKTDKEQVNTNLDFCWSAYLAKKWGAEHNVIGKTGLTTRDFVSTSNNYMNTLENSKSQVYFIGLGVNDANILGQDYIGTRDDILSDYNLNKDTYYGNYAKIIQFIHEKHPDSLVICFNNPMAGNEIQNNYNNAVKEIVSIFNEYCFLCDMYKYYPMYHEGILALDRINNHYTPIGYSLMANLIENETSYIIRNNISKFQNLAFIDIE